MVKKLIAAAGISLIIYAINRTPERIISPLPTGVEAYSPVAGSPTSVHRVIRGKASWYGSSKTECLGCSPDRITASGAKFDELRFTAACTKRWALGQTLTVRYREKMVRVTCTDRGGFETRHGRILDLAAAAFKELAPLDKGVIDVEVTK